MHYSVVPLLLLSLLLRHLLVLSLVFDLPLLQLQPEIFAVVVPLVMALVVVDVDVLVSMLMVVSPVLWLSKVLWLVIMVVSWSTIWAVFLKLPTLTV